MRLNKRQYVIWDDTIRERLSRRVAQLLPALPLEEIPVRNITHALRLAQDEILPTNQQRTITTATRFPFLLDYLKDNPPGLIPPEPEPTPIVEAKPNHDNLNFIVDIIAELEHKIDNMNATMQTLIASSNTLNMQVSELNRAIRRRKKKIRPGITVKVLVWGLDIRDQAELVKKKVAGLPNIEVDFRSGEITPASLPRCNQVIMLKRIVPYRLQRDAEHLFKGRLHEAFGLTAVVDLISEFSTHPEKYGLDA